MKPYYDDGKGILIYHGDALQILPELAPSDLIVTDPKYNCGMDYGKDVDDDLPWPTYVAWLRTIIECCEANCNGPVFMFLSVNGLLEITPFKRPRHVCVWDKPMSFSPRLGGSPFLPHWEPCAVFGRVWGKGGRVPDWHLQDVWHHLPAKRNGHPCPKPESLILQIIGASPAGLVCDPMMGSGTTLRAAKDLGRKAIGIEIEERYCEIAAKRLAQEVLDFAAAGDRAPAQ